MRIVDIHVHPVSRGMVLDPRNLRFMERGCAMLLDVPAEKTLLERMDAGGIAVACLMGPNPHEGITLSNDVVHKLVESHPTRFVGFLGVDPVRDGPSQTKAAIEQAVDQWGFKGVGEIGGCDFLAPEWAGVFETCIQKQIPVLVHMGVPLPSMLLKYGHPFLLDELAHRYPELTIIAAHSGAPWIMETLAVLVRHPNVYLDISTLPAIHEQLARVVLALCASRGLEERVLFGSDFPVVDPCNYAIAVSKFTVPASIRWLMSVPAITPSFKQKILEENAIRLLRLDI
jgi:predicted TIM-barrel fold metal-dependent hydrolase